MARPLGTPFSSPEYEDLLLAVRVPARYLGGELHQVLKNPLETALRWALLYPDVYEVGMAHQGLRILYHVLNQEPDLWAERGFCPWPDMEAALRRKGWPLTTLESRTPLGALDVVGFTLQTELSYTNILTCLDLGGIPLRTQDRGEDDPLVVAGGAGALNPEPLADFFDFFFLGDGEQAVVEFSRVLLEERGRHPRRHDRIRAVAERCPFLYAPSLWQPRFDGPALAAMEPLEGIRKSRRALVYDLENAPYPTRPVLPHIRTIHDRISIEIMRGCVQGCRFCQAGYEKRPQRFRSAKKIRRLAEETYRNTGLNEIGLTSLSSSDHPGLGRILDELSASFQGMQVSLSLPSLRVDEQVSGLVQRSTDVRRHGLTLAPEVATDRLRRIINKGIRDADLFEGAGQAWKNGFRHMKLYFMAGIPGETEADLAGIVRMAERCSLLRREAGLGGPGQVNVSVSTFVPKPLTPFQWHAQMRPEVVAATQEFLCGLRKVRAVRLRCHAGGGTLVEGFLSRADRRAGRVIEAAWRAGARFDAWSEHLDLAAWQQAWKAAGLGPAETAFRTRPLWELLPWDHLDLGVRRSYLEEEWDRALQSDFTPHCQTESCGDCGVGAKTCVDIKALTGLFPRFAREKLVARAGSNPLLQPEPGRTTLEPEDRSRPSSSVQRSPCSSKPIPIPRSPKSVS
ncbi:MAG: TIGR03960 family B12-binding radical SAM protein [Planctomycetota bacterium]